MFEIKGYVFYGTEGICRVDDIVAAPFSGIDPNVKYYVLHSTHGGNNTSFVPVEGAESLMRRIMSEAELTTFIGKISSLTLFEEESLKQMKEKYNLALRSGDPLEWMRVIKTVNARMLDGREGGKKVSDAEVAISNNAKRYLYKEISIVLDIPEENVEKYIYDNALEATV